MCYAQIRDFNYRMLRSGAFVSHVSEHRYSDHPRLPSNQGLSTCLVKKKYAHILCYKYISTEDIIERTKKTICILNRIVSSSFIHDKYYNEYMCYT